MSIWCIVPGIIALIIGYAGIYCLCHIAADADRRIDDMGKSVQDEQAM